jgi:hypothetical protein
MDMWHAEHTLDTTAPPEQVWARLQKVAEWPQGTMKFQSEGPRSFLLAAVNAPCGFTALTRLPLAQVRHIHLQESSAIGTRITHRIEISGPLFWLYALSRGRRMREGLAPSMRRLARLACA